MNKKEIGSEDLTRAAYNHGGIEGVKYIMTSEAEKAAAIYKSNDAAKGVYYSSGRVPAFLAGCKWMLEQANVIVKEMSDAEFPASDAEIRGAWILFNKLGLLVEGENE